MEEDTKDPKEKEKKKVGFLNMREALMGIEAPPKVDKGIVRLKLHGNNKIFR